MELYFEILREKTHIFCHVRESSTVLELKEIIEGILKISPELQTLKKPINENRSEWNDLSDDNQTLFELGFTYKNAKADEPAILALVLPEDNNSINIVPLSLPPPLPEAMRSTREAET